MSRTHAWLLAVILAVARPVVWWNRIDVATGLMPVWTKATGLSVAIEPPAVSDRWTGTVDLSGTGGVFAQDASASRPPAIARLDSSTEATVLVSGRVMEKRLGLLIGGAWRGVGDRAVPIEPT